MLANLTEELVIRRISELVRGRRDLCTCERCQDDMAALALDGLPARYYTSRRGGIHRELEALRESLRIEMADRCLRSIEKVARAPRHDAEEARPAAPALPSAVRDPGARARRPEIPKPRLT